MIIPVGYVGQQSLLSAYDILGDKNEWMNAETCFDVGCGRGAFAVYLCELLPKLRLFGIDISSESIENAQRIAFEKNLSSRLIFRAYDIEQIPSIKYIKFDSIISADVIQHSENPIRILSLLLDRWSKVGPIRISSWYFSNTTEGAEIARKWGFYCPVTFETYYTNVKNMDKGLFVTDSNDKFLSHIEASLDSLVKLEDDLRHYFDNKIVDDRLRLEECTVTAVRRGNMGQVVVTSRANNALQRTPLRSAAERKR